MAEGLAGLGAETDPEVILAAALALQAPWQGRNHVDLADPPRQLPQQPSRRTELAVQRRWQPPPSEEIWRAKLVASPLVAQTRAKSMPADDAADDAAAVRPLILDGSCLYTLRFWRLQQALVDDLHRRARPAVSSVLSARQMEALACWFDDPALRKAAERSLSRRLLVISGGPGSGKTTLARRLVALHAAWGRQGEARLSSPGAANPSLSVRVALAAPTARAAQRLQESLTEADSALEEGWRAWGLSLELLRSSLAGLRGQTIHRLLGYGYRRPIEPRRLPFACIVVDEASMIDLELMVDLLRAAPEATLILLGDADQLPSVGGGSLLGAIGAAAEAVPLETAEANATAEVISDPEARSALDAGTVTEASATLDTAEAGTVAEARSALDAGAVVDAALDTAEAGTDPKARSALNAGTVGDARSDPEAGTAVVLDAALETAEASAAAGVISDPKARSTPEAGTAVVLDAALETAKGSTTAEALSDPEAGTAVIAPLETAETNATAEAVPLENTEASATAEGISDPEARSALDAGTVTENSVTLDTGTTHSSLGGVVLRLSGSHRFRAESGVGRFAAACRRRPFDVEEALAALEEGEDIRWDTTSDDADSAAASTGRSAAERSTVGRSAATRSAGHSAGLSSEQLALFARRYERCLSELRTNPHDVQVQQRALARFASFRVLCWQREGPRGTQRINRALTVRINWAFGKRIDRAGVRAAEIDPFWCGRPLMITLNDYALQRFNGEAGLVCAGGESEGAAYVIFPSPGDRQGVPLRLGVSALPAHETALASTVHKAQGAQFDEVALVLPAEDSSLLQREWLYTAITRARRSLHLVGSRDVVRAALLRHGAADAVLVAKLRGAASSNT